MAALAARCEGAARWQASSIDQALRTGALGWIAEYDEDLVGLILVRIAADEMEILNLAVAPLQRRNGVATRLLMQSIRHATKLGVKKAYLEVRSSNDGGREFYVAHRFRVCGCRENYYTAPVDDALLLSRELKAFDGGLRRETPVTPTSKIHRA